MRVHTRLKFANFLAVAGIWTLFFSLSFNAYAGALDFATTRCESDFFCRQDTEIMKTAESR